VEPLFAFLEESIQLMAVRARADGTELVLVLIPSKLQVEPEDDAEMIQTLASLLHLSPPLDAVESMIRERITEIAQGLDMPVIDLYPPLRRQWLADQERLYYRFDWHLNPRGNAAIGKALFEHLTGDGVSCAPQKSP
jgi:hypothetical protein